MRNDKEAADALAASFQQLRQEIGKVIVGQDEVVRLVLTAVFSQGHSLLVGVPGLAKTLLIQTIADSLDLSFNRIQFTPDLMPSDIVGSETMNQQRDFHFVKGPIFANIILADEINRTPPKTQAALLEAMQERSVTLDGTSHKLSDRFMVVATQNPIEQQGVYPLPEAQLDRFLFKHVVDYPTEEQERRIVGDHGSRFGAPKPEDWGIEQVVTSAEIAEALAAVQSNRLATEIVAYVVSLVRATRQSADLEAGASPRAAAMLAGAARAKAALDGRDYVVPDDVKALAPSVLRHRVILSPTAQIDGLRAETIIARLIDQVDAPR